MKKPIEKCKDLQLDDDERKTLERFGEVWIIYETNGFGLGFSRRCREDPGAPAQT